MSGRELCILIIHRLDKRVNLRPEVRKRRYWVDWIYFLVINELIRGRLIQQSGGVGLTLVVVFV